VHYVALKAAMQTDVELAKSSAVQRRIFNSLLTTGKEAVDSNTLSMAKSVEGIKQEIDLSTKLLVLKDGLTASEMRQIEARRAKQMASKAYIATLANQQFGFKPGEAMATSTMFNAASKEDEIRTQKKQAEQEVANAEMVRQANIKQIAAYRAAEETKRAEASASFTLTRTAAVGTVAAIKAESAVRATALSSLERGEQKITELMQGRNKLTRAEATETLRAMGWTREYEAINSTSC